VYSYTCMFVNISLFIFLGPVVAEAVSTMNDGDVILLENVRFYPEEVSSYMRIYLYLDIYKFSCIHMHIYICIYTYACIHMHDYMHIHIYSYINMYLIRINISIGKERPCIRRTACS
jgi:hypothetical protein